MRSFQRKSRLVSFRVSESEYECLRQTAAIHGARGISDIARFAIRTVLLDPIQEEGGPRNLDGYADGLVRTLTLNLEHLNHKVDELAQRLDLLKDSAREL